MESSEEYEVLKTIPCAKLEFNNPATTYTILSLPDTGAGQQIYQNFNYLQLKLDIWSHTRKIYFLNNGAEMQCQFYA